MRAPLFLPLAVLAIVSTDCIPKKTPQATSPLAAEATRVPPPKLPGNPAPATPGGNVPAIKVNTVGYPREWRKIAVFNVDPLGAVVRDAAGNVVLQLQAGKIEQRGTDQSSRDPVWQVDLSELDRPGRYSLAVGDAVSDPFVIGDRAYAQALMLAQKMFYFQRTRTRLDPPYAVWENDAFVRTEVSHAHENVGYLIEDYPERKRRWEVRAGWHDAGNFDMYVPSTAPTAQGLLMAFERRPDLFQDRDLNIPESGNGVPDLLDEARWGIEWVYSMQAPDGAFRLRETTMTQSEVKPGPADRDRSTRYVDRPGSASTAKGTALAAAAARVYSVYDPAFAERSLAVARRGFEWLVRHPERLLVPPTGAAVHNQWLLWDDGKEVKSDVGARFNAAAQIYRTLRDERALAQIEALLKSHETRSYDFPYGSWTNLTRWGCLELARDPDAPEALRAEAKTRLLQAATMSRDQATKKDGYRCALLPQDYYWGSASNLAERAQLLMWAVELDPEGYGWAREVARDQWHWILGRNPNGHSLVTRVGKGPRALYHLEWGPHGPKVPPGYLIGGPNYDNMKFLAPGAPAKALLWESPRDLESGTPRGELWHWNQSDLWEGGFLPRDDWSEGWWAVTEPDIYYNMNLVLLAIEMQD